MTATIAIPVMGDGLSPHFGHCEKFAFYQVVDDVISGGEQFAPPEHEHGKHIEFLKEHGCDTLIAGGMGLPAQEMCLANGIDIYRGIPGTPLEDLVQMLINGDLQLGARQCDHSDHGAHHNH